MKYLDKYPECSGCPVVNYCGTMISSSRLCNSYNDNESLLDFATDEELKEYYEDDKADYYIEMQKAYPDFAWKLKERANIK